MAGQYKRFSDTTGSRQGEQRPYTKNPPISDFVGQDMLVYGWQSRKSFVGGRETEYIIVLFRLRGDLEVHRANCSAKVLTAQLQHCTEEDFPFAAKIVQVPALTPGSNPWLRFADLDEPDAEPEAVQPPELPVQPVDVREYLASADLSKLAEGANKSASKRGS